MIWSYCQHGSFSSGDGQKALVAYSGFGAFKNAPQAESLHDAGPIPRGAYVCGTPYDHPQFGPHVIPLTPTQYTDTHGRSGFFIHGDSIAHPGEASHGCLIVERAIRELIQPHDLLLVWA